MSKIKNKKGEYYDYYYDGLRYVGESLEECKARLKAKRLRLAKGIKK